MLVATRHPGPATARSSSTSPASHDRHRPRPDRRPAVLALTAPSSRFDHGHGPLAAESSSDVAGLLDQSLAVARDGDEAVMLGEGGRGFVNGVHDHQSCGGNVLAATARLRASSSSSPRALVRAGTGQERAGRAAPPEWRRVNRSRPLGKLGADDKVGGEAEVGHHQVISSVPDEGPCRTHRVSMARAPRWSLVSSASFPHENWSSRWRSASVSETNAATSALLDLARLGSAPPFG